MLGQRWKQWATIMPVLDQGLMFAGYLVQKQLLISGNLISQPHSL